MIKNIFTLFIAFLLISISYATRPLTVEDTGVVEKGMEVELSSDAYFPDNFNNTIGGVFNFALFSGWQIGIENSLEHEPPYHPQGNNDSDLTVKYSFNNEWAIKGTSDLTNGDKDNGFGDQYLDHSLTLVHGFEMNKNFGIDTNLGYTFYDHHEWYSEEVQDNWNIGIAVKYQFLENLKLVAEATKMIVKKYLDNKTENQILFRAGLAYEVLGLKWDTAFYSMPATGQNYGFTAGVTIPVTW